MAQPLGLHPLVFSKTFQIPIVVYEIKLQPLQKIDGLKWQWHN